ncbi:MAG: phosphoribosyltransferase [Candidatus Methanomethylicota archaeon]|uniref:Phosphoribosyltransferase n=1 Tax=Thermoproteota archaeon TaxID=2056631 RepID=A0A497ETY6_9CREN|nr:MAG: phosphoribosyltransferase [Candidatus Verstraetearchaeota archaeon]
MSPQLFEDTSLRDKLYVFKDRRDAGRKLANMLSPRYQGLDCVVLAIPSGGVPVALEVAKHLNAELDIVICRKIPIPFNKEAGFGAISPDGDIYLNRALVRSLGLDNQYIRWAANRVLSEIKRREQVFRMNRPPVILKNKHVILVDDGLASGYTMLAAVHYVKKREPSKVIVAVPTSPNESINLLLPHVDELYCLNVRDIYPFAVADAYEIWYDLSDQEVVSLLKEAWNMS